MDMSDRFDATDAPEGGVPGKPKWRTPVLSVDSISDSTRHYFSRGIDNYERTSPHYGS
jgi:hypothetical protein